MIPILINHLLTGKLGSKDKQVIAFFNEVDSVERAKIEAYLHNSSDEEILKTISTFPLSVRNLLALAKQEIHVLLPLTCDKIKRSHRQST